MSLEVRIKSAAVAALLHFGVSAAVASLVALMVFGVWYPSPLHELTGGQTLFVILIAVDVVCGPLLTLVVYDPRKSLGKRRLDLGFIVLIQLSALIYGIGQVASARPIFVAFEGDRFRVVQAFDVDQLRTHEVAGTVSWPSYSGPRIIGVHLAQSGDTDYLASVQLSMQGMHPAFRPTRWRPYETQVPVVLQQLRPLRDLFRKNPERTSELKKLTKTVSNLGLTEAQVGYLPLVRDLVTDWVVLVRRADGLPLAYLHLDGWE